MNDVPAPEPKIITQNTSTTTDQLLSLHTWWRPWSDWSSSISALWWVLLWTLSLHQSGRRHHLPPGRITVSPGEAWKHCEDHVLWFLQCFQHHTACTLGDKLELAGVNQHLTSWILDHLTDRPQYVRTQDYVSDTITCSTVAHREHAYVSGPARPGQTHKMELWADHFSQLQVIYHVTISKPIIRLKLLIQVTVHFCHFPQ